MEKPGKEIGGQKSDKIGGQSSIPFTIEEIKYASDLAFCIRKIYGGNPSITEIILDHRKDLAKSKQDRLSDQKARRKTSNLSNTDIRKRRKG